MTQLVVRAGACGYDVRVAVEKLDRHTVRVALASECEQIAALQSDIAELNWRKGVFCHIAESRIYQAASLHLNHAACPVPSAILKAIEVEVGIALPRDIVFHFE
ncbi:MAG: hypothetical protein M1132_01260 [Chloroflexi bacterium]|nr:hypothetical protein [Chloroflexota bacterium]